MAALTGHEQQQLRCNSGVTGTVARLTREHALTFDSGRREVDDRTPGL